MHCGEPDLPPRILEAVTALWEAHFKTEAQAIDSARFRMLRHICRRTSWGYLETEYVKYS
jgi:hypothetical protein